MGDAAAVATYADYLALEATSEGKHEYLNGHIVAMAGGTPGHALLAANVIGTLADALRRGPCRAFTSDLRVRIRATGRATYPDVTVVCGKGEHDPEDPDALTNPTVLVEVLSPTTELGDRGEKFAHYRRIPSLRHYVLVSQHEPRIEVYSRVGGEWRFTEAVGTGAVTLEAVACELALDRIYEDPTGLLQLQTS